MWNKVALLLSLTLLLCSTSNAQEGRFTLVPEGGIVKFQATCFDDLATAKLLTWKEFQEKEFQSRLDFRLNTQRTDYEFKIDTLKVELEELGIRHTEILKLRDKEIKDLRDIIKKDRKVNIPLLVTASIVGGIGIGVGTVYIANQVSK